MSQVLLNKQQQILTKYQHTYLLSSADKQEKPEGDADCKDNVVEILSNNDFNVELEVNQKLIGINNYFDFSINIWHEK